MAGRTKSPESSQPGQPRLSSPALDPIPEALNVRSRDSCQIGDKFRISVRLAGQKRPML
jgi:hypothetical protein